jgi:hypothetical protein
MKTALAYVGCMIAFSTACASLQAAQPGSQKSRVGAEQVELFAAMKSGDVAVRFLPKNAKEANVLIENKGNQPLAIKLPEAFAGVPVLAQIGGRGFPGGGGRAGGNPVGGAGGLGGAQGVGGGFGGGGLGGGGLGGGGLGGGGGLFNIEPGKVGKIKVATTCLEHGKQDPNARIHYELRPIESFTNNRQVIEVCAMLGRGEVSQNAAQAAAWHLTNGLGWEELANKDRVHLSNGYTEKYFTPEELAMAARVVEEAARRAGVERVKKSSSSDLASQK